MSEYSDSYDETSYEESSDPSGEEYYEAPAEEPVADPCMDEPAPVEEPSYSEDPHPGRHHRDRQSETDYSDETTDTETGTRRPTPPAPRQPAPRATTPSPRRPTPTAARPRQPTREADPTAAPTYEQQVEQTDQAVDDYQVGNRCHPDGAWRGRVSDRRRAVRRDAPITAHGRRISRPTQDSSDLWSPDAGQRRGALLLRRGERAGRRRRPAGGADRRRADRDPCRRHGHFGGLGPGCGFRGGRCRWQLGGGGWSRRPCISRPLRGRGRRQRRAGTARLNPGRARHRPCICKPVRGRGRRQRRAGTVRLTCRTWAPALHLQTRSRACSALTAGWT